MKARGRSVAQNTPCRVTSPARTASGELLTVRETFGYRCDRCHSKRGVEVFDKYLLCPGCKDEMLRALEGEL
jgi:Zn finger protein HypA/HybF involved in hydrogenase expression